MKPAFIKTLTIILASLALTFSAIGVTPAYAAGPWYVAPGGDDGNSCASAGSPCATINGAIGKAASGDTIMVAAGTYTWTTFSSVVGISKSIILSGGWNAAFTTRNGVSIIDGENTTKGISIFGNPNAAALNVTLDYFVIQNGFATNGAGIYTNSNVNLIINNSTLINNVASSQGGGIQINDGTLTLNNTTISGNQGGTGGGGGYGGGGIFIYSGTMALNNSTVSGNITTQKGGGIYIGGTVTMRNSILANNSASLSGPDCFGTINSSEHNIVGNTSACTATPGAGNQFNVNPLISAYPVGVAGYYTLLAGSPAIDAGNPATCLTTDQRGMVRPQGSTCDIGAYEYVAAPGVAASFGYAGGANQRAAIGMLFSKPLAVYVLDSNGSAVSGITVSFTAPGSEASGTFTDSGTNTTTALSDSSGLAIPAAFTANSQSGSYNVTANTSGLAGTLSFALTNALPWYVTPTGNDGNTCASVAAPCLTINGAIGKAAAGDTIQVASGTYTSASSPIVNIDKSITLSGSWDPTFTSRSGPSIIDGQGTSLGIFVSGITNIEYFSVENGNSCSGGGILNYGSLTILNSTIINNKTDNICGAGGGGIWSYGSLNVINTTISGNISHHGGGIYISGGSVDMNNVTLADNSSTNLGGGIYIFSGTATLKNSILARNTATNSGPDCGGTINSSGYNLVGNNFGCTFNASTGDLLNVDPKLGALTGSLGYHPLLPGSPAINAGNLAGCMGSAGLLTTDQRGYPRFGRCDIGAYEAQPIAFSTMTANQVVALPDVPVTYTITLNNGGASDIANVVVTDALPSSLNYISASLTATSGSYNYTNGVITWTGSVNAGSSVTITFGATIGQVPIGTVITNSAVINGAGEIITRSAAVNVDYYRIFLPLTLKKYPSGIHGRVTINGTPVAGVPLVLRFFDGSTDSILATTNTDADGDYSFAGAPSLSTGQTYYVRYLNDASTPGRLGVWFTRQLTTYTAGSEVEIGNFDIADIALVTPAAGATVSLPRTFQWTPRPASPSDSYEFDLYDPGDGNPYFWTDPLLGYVGAYTLTGLPPGFSRNVQYAWEIWVYSPDGGYGVSYWAYGVKFSNSGSGMAAPQSVLPNHPRPTRDLPPRK